jgi:DNA-binding beta-propeller fold protein YncE
MIADNREIAQIDPKSGDAIGDRVEIAGAESLAVDDRFAWVVSSSGTVTRLDAESLSAVGTPIRVPHAVDVAIGGGSVWVAAADGRVTRLDGRTGARVGRPIRVGRHASGIDADAEAVWVVSARGGTVTRITP